MKNLGRALTDRIDGLWRGDVHNSLLQFKPLEHELGFHDLLSPHVKTVAIGDVLVSRHEGLHEELISRTPYGWMQRNFAFIANNLRDGSVLEVPLRTWVALSVEASRNAHESYATYLSIKAARRSEEPSLLERHPAEYQGYFNTLASTVDKHFETSYLQYLVGKALATAAFVGDFVQFLATVDDLTKVELPDQQRPDYRLARILEQFEPLFLEPIRASIEQSICALIDGNDVPLRFPRSENDWESLPEDTLQVLNFQILGDLHPLVWNITERQLQLPVLNRKLLLSPSVAGESLLKELMKSEELPFTATFSNATARPTIDSEIQNERLRLGRTGIYNERALTRAVPLDRDKPLSRYLTSRNIVITRGFYGPEEEVQWRLISFEGGVATHYDLQDEVVVQALNLDRPYRVSQGRTNVLDTTVVGVDGFMNFLPLYERYGDVFEHADHVARYHTSFWYMGGNIVDWIDSPLFEGEARLHKMLLLSREPGESGRKPKGKTKGYRKLADDAVGPQEVPARIFCVQSRIAHGYFVRILPGYESQMIKWNEPEGGFGEFSEDEQRYFSHVLKKIVRAIYSTWSSF